MAELSKRAIFDKIFGNITTKKADDNDLPLNFTPPPYFGEKSIKDGFDCIDCSAPCVLACKRNLLEFDGKAVKFSLNSQGCNFCKECAIACQESGHEVLSLKNKPYIQGQTKVLPNSCIAWNGVICYNCQDACSFNAIEYFGVFRPIINKNCVNCGECVVSCFENAVSFK